MHRLAKVHVVHALWVGNQGAVSVESDRRQLPPRFVRFLRFIVQSGASDATPVAVAVLRRVLTTRLETLLVVRRKNVPVHGLSKLRLCRHFPEISDCSREDNFRGEGITTTDDYLPLMNTIDECDDDDSLWGRLICVTCIGYV